MNVLFPQIFKGFDVICDILVTVPCSRLNVVVITPVTPGICRICFNVTVSNLLPYHLSVISIVIIRLSALLISYFYYNKPCRKSH